MSVKQVQFIRRLQNTVPLAIGIKAVAKWSRSSFLKALVLKIGSLFSSSEAQSTLALIVTPHITIDDTTVAGCLGETAGIPAPASNKAHVGALGGQTKMSRETNFGDSTSESGENKGIEIQVRSDPNGGNGCCVPQMRGFSTSTFTNRNSRSFYRNHVFRAGSNNVGAMSPSLTGLRARH